MTQIYQLTLQVEEMFDEESVWCQFLSLHNVFYWFIIQSKY